MYSRMKRSSLKRGHALPNFTKDEFVEWCEYNNFTKLYEEWINSNFTKDLSPSVDRFDNNVGYELTNMQLITWKKNNENGNSDRKSGKYVTQHKPVVQYDADLNFIAEYVSIREASRQTSINDYTIILVCRDKRKTAGGYIWKYKKDNKCLNI